MTPSEAPKALQPPAGSELLDTISASCWISAHHPPAKFGAPDHAYDLRMLSLPRLLVVLCDADSRHALSGAHMCATPLPCQHGLQRAPAAACNTVGTAMLPH